MNKGLEAVERIKKFDIKISYLNSEGAVCHYLSLDDELREDLKIIKTELKRLEQQDNKIKELKSLLHRACKMNEDYCGELNKQDEILRILKEHIEYGFTHDEETKKRINLISIHIFENEPEYDLLKEELL